MGDDRQTRRSRTGPNAETKHSGQRIFLGAVVALGCMVLGYMIFSGHPNPDPGSDTVAAAVPGNPQPRPSAASTTSQLRLEDIPFNGERAYGYLKQLCAIGPRPSGSPGMIAARKLLAEHFKKAGGQVEYQSFPYRHPENGSRVTIVNMIVRWFPERKNRILLCTHYDTLPFPLLDPINRRGRFVGANDGTSGVAVMMEMAHDMPKLPTKYGVDFVLFDAEEFMFRENGRFFVGSEYFARAYLKDRAKYRYRWGVLLDMVGDADLRFYQEGYSATWRDTRPLVQDIWATAERLGVREFVPRVGDRIRDDHLPLHNIGRIPCCNIIDFDYPAWHTQNDTPEQCSALSLAKVGWVIREWLKAVE